MYYIAIYKNGNDREIYKSKSLLDVLADLADDNIIDRYADYDNDENLTDEEYYKNLAENYSPCELNALYEDYNVTFTYADRIF